MSERSDLREALFLRLPKPLARLAYALARSTFRKDVRKPYFETALRRVAESRTAGDYLEFGVYRGSSFITNYKLARKYRLSDMRFFAFDGFAGLPEDEGDIWERSMFRSSKEGFLRNVEKAGVLLDRVRVVEGMYSDTLTAETKARHGLTKAAVVHVDCDLYSSTSVVLAFIEDLIDEGSIVIFDDWYMPGGDTNCGEKRAFTEWPFSHCSRANSRSEGKSFSSSPSASCISWRTSALILSTSTSGEAFLSSTAFSFRVVRTSCGTRSGSSIPRCPSDRISAGAVMRPALSALVSAW